MDPICRADQGVTCISEKPMVNHITLSWCKVEVLLFQSDCIGVIWFSAVLDKLSKRPDQIDRKIKSIERVEDIPCCMAQHGRKPVAAESEFVVELPKGYKYGIQTCNRSKSAYKSTVIKTKIVGCRQEARFVPPA